jgi:hypothetical protein
MMSWAKLIRTANKQVEKVHFDFAKKLARKDEEHKAQAACPLNSYDFVQ